jgi:hypothetical protein
LLILAIYQESGNYPEAPILDAQSFLAETQEFMEFSAEPHPAVTGNTAFFGGQFTKNLSKIFCHLY